MINEHHISTGFLDIMLHIITSLKMSKYGLGGRGYQNSERKLSLVILGPYDSIYSILLLIMM